MSDLEAHATFMAGAERAVQHWLAYWQAHAGDHEALGRVYGHALRIVSWCSASESYPPAVFDLATAMHQYVWYREPWHQWEALLSNLLARANNASPQHLFDLRGLIASICFRVHRLEESIALLEENYLWAAAVGDRRRQADSATGLAESYLNAGAPEQAIRYAEEAASLAEGLGVSWYRVDGLINSARALMALNDLAGAEQRLRQAAALASAENLATYQAKAELFLGHLFSRRGQWQAALAHFQAALAWVTSYGDGAGQAVVKTHMGRALAELGRPEEAASLLEEALRLHRHHGNLPGEQIASQRLEELTGRTRTDDPPSPLREQD